MGVSVADSGHVEELHRHYEAIDVYLHYVLDLWLQKKWRSHEVEGDAIIVRYVDDVVVGFQHKRDAERFLNAVKERVRMLRTGNCTPTRPGSLSSESTPRSVATKRGQGRPETFDFLGFTHYCNKTREGSFVLGRKPVAKRMRRTLKRIKEELRRRMHVKDAHTAKWLGQVLVANENVPR